MAIFFGQINLYFTKLLSILTLLSEVKMIKASIVHTVWVVVWYALSCNFQRHGRHILFDGRMKFTSLEANLGGCWGLFSLSHSSFFLPLSLRGVPTWLKYCWLGLYFLTQSISHIIGIKDPSGHVFFCFFLIDQILSFYRYWLTQCWKLCQGLLIFTI